MGYSSQVAYSIVFKDKRTLNEFIALVMLQGGYDVEALKECYIDWDNCQVHYHAWNIKWYEVYPYVQGHNSLREFAHDRFEKECSTKFVRIGEELNDNEEEWHQGFGASEQAAATKLHRLSREGRKGLRDQHSRGEPPTRCFRRGQLLGLPRPPRHRSGEGPRLTRFQIKPTANLR